LETWADAGTEALRFTEFAVRKILLILACFLCWGNLAPAWAQFEDAAPGAGDSAGKGPQLGDALTKKIKIGVRVKAVGGPIRGITATVPVPIDWPEQKVTIGEEDLSPGVHHSTYRTLDGGGAKQMVISIPNIAAGEEAHALVTFEVTRHSLLPPEDTSIYKEPVKEKLPKDILPYLGVSPYIEVTHPKIQKLAKEVAEDKSGWEKVEAIYDATRERVEYKNGPLKGALRALNDGTGDCEELTSLFIALCRASGIPARSVWVPDHCYPEFYLVDGDGKGYWFPCQSAGSRAFGGIPEHRAILQKGDNFHDPDRPKDKLRYVSEFLRGTPAAKGAGKPQVEFVRDWE
jgi:hypothetical protein